MKQLSRIKIYYQERQYINMAWTDDKKQEAVELYLAEAPTAATSAEIVKSIAEKLEESPNGVRMILNAAGVYVKVEPSSIPAKKGSVAAGGEEKAPRVSKESQQ